MKNGEITIRKLLMSCLNILFKQLEFDVLPKTKNFQNGCNSKCFVR